MGWFTLLLLSGLLLIPAFLVFRWETDAYNMMDWAITSGTLRHSITVFHAILGWGSLALVGALWTIHMRSHWRRHENRINGLTFALIWLSLMGSALGIYYFGDPDWSQYSSLIHTAFGVLLPVALIFHRINGRKSLARRKK